MIVARVDCKTSWLLNFQPKNVVLTASKTWVFGAVK